MATYKVIQDIEAEDKLIGPFGIRQFIYLIIVVASGFLIFKIIVSGVWYLALPFLPHTLFFALLALPFGGDQSTETWLLAKIRFAIKPRVRIWNQTGVQNLVTITVPKKEERPLTHSLTEGEVKSRLQALANTLDSRGWAVKNLNINVFTPAYAGMTMNSSDRLIDVSSTRPLPDDSIPVIADMMDEHDNPVARNLDRMIEDSTKAHRQQVINSIRNTGNNQFSQQPQIGSQQPQTPQSQIAPTSGFVTPDPITRPDYWFMNQNQSGSLGQYNSSNALPASGNLIMPDPTATTQQQSSGFTLKPLAPSNEPLTDEELLEKIHSDRQNKLPHRGLKVIKTLDEQQADEEATKYNKEISKEQDKPEPSTNLAQLDNPTMTSEPDPDIIKLARNDDRSLESIARQANKLKEQDSSDGEVVIKLH